MRRPLLSLICLAAAGIGASAEYRFEPLPETKVGRVTIKIDQPRTQFRMPAWAPGDYEILNYGTKVVEIQFLLADKPVAHVRTADPNLWTVPGGADSVVYTVAESGGNFSPNLRVRPEETFVSGPGVFGWFDGEDNEEQTLAIASANKKVAIALPATSKSDDWSTFTARDYTEMIDSPFVVATDFLSAEFTVGGKNHRVIGYNSYKGADMQAFASVAQPIVEANFKMFGSLPYKEYIFFCDFKGGGGGLEHLSSTKLGIWSMNPVQNASLISHEYFHAFNVKTIREKTLGPFDYTKPAAVSTLWWLEGVTDYYADVMICRSGLGDQSAFYNDIGSSYNALLRNPNRLKVTASQSSENVWLTKGSNGWGGLSYYHKGKLVGACLDLAIRSESKGAHTLDDVMQALYAENENRKPGYTAAHLRELCVKFGGAKLGPIYDRCVNSTEELPMDDLLAQEGLIRDGAKIESMGNGAGKTNWPNTTRTHFTFGAPF